MKKYQLGLYEKALPDTLSLAEKQAAAKAAGYDYIEMSIDATEAKIARVYAPAADLKLSDELPVGSFCVSALTKYAIGSEDAAIRERGMDIAFRSLELAATLGVRVVMIPGYDVYFEPGTEATKARFIENSRKIAEYAAVLGVNVGYETMENEFMNTMTKARTYVDLVDNPYLGIYPDLGNMTNAAVLHGTDLAEDIAQGKGHIFAMHLKETKPGIFREVPYGTGHVDFEAGVKQAWSLGVRRFVTEFWYVGSDSWQEETVATCCRFRELLDRQEG